MGNPRNDNDNQFDHDDRDAGKSRKGRDTLPEYDIEEHRVTSPMSRPELEDLEDDGIEEPELDEMPEDDGPDA